MKKLVLFFCIHIFFLQVLIGQIEKLFYFEVFVINNEQYTQNLSLFLSGRYFMYIEILFPAYSYGEGLIDYQIDDLIISIGNYQIKNDTLLLTDDYTQARWILKIDNPYIYPLQVSPYMNKIVYVDYGRLPYDHRFQTPKISYTSKIEHFVENTQNIHNLAESYRFNYGRPIVFSLDYTGDFYLFCKNTSVVDEEKIETSYMKPRKNVDILFSSGTWSRDGNILILKDTSLHHEFYGLIKDDETVQLLMFGFDETVFKKR